MSDEPLRRLAEALQSLQYPHPLSASSFRVRNFELMASILCWMVHRLDPGIQIHDKIGSDSEKLQFLDGIVEGLATRMNLHLNTKELNSADGDAVIELLKVADVLQEASALADEVSTSSDEDFQPDAIIQTAKTARALSNDITGITSRLCGLLESGDRDSKEREKTLRYLNSLLSTPGGNCPEQDHLGTSIDRILDDTHSAVERLDKQCRIMISNQRGMEEKIRKKTIDLERTSKRLDSLRHVRPAYMDEYEQLEEELQVEYDRYVVRLRNLDYLEEELNSFKQLAIERQNKAERSMRRMQNKFREEELKVLNGHRDHDSETNAGDDSTSSHHSLHLEEANNTHTILAETARTGDASSTGSTPRDRASFGKSEGSPSDSSSNVGSVASFEGSEMRGSLSSDDSDDFF